MCGKTRLVDRLLRSQNGLELGDGGDCKDYSEKELNINKIGDCEKDSASRSGDRGQFSLPS